MKKRLTQKDLGSRVNITQAHLSAILSGKLRAGYDTAEKLAAITGSSIALWIKGTPQERQHIFKKWATQKNGISN